MNTETEQAYINDVQHLLQSTKIPGIKFNYDCYYDWRMAWIWLDDQIHLTADQLQAMQLIQRLMDNYEQKRSMK